jgi:hypothetical protein
MQAIKAPQKAGQFFLHGYHCQRIKTILWASSRNLLASCLRLVACIPLSTPVIIRTYLYNQGLTQAIKRCHAYAVR